MISLRNIIILMFCVFVIGILLFRPNHNQPRTYAYLISHPDALAKQSRSCALRVLRGSYCKMVSDASRDYLNLYEQWRESPQGFGKTILKLEMEGSDTTAITKDVFSQTLTRDEIIAAYLAVVGSNPVE